MSKIISLESINVRFDRKIILENVNLSIDEGDFVAVSGPNGGGKTTLMRVILKLLAPTAGKVEYFCGDKTVKHLKTGYLPQKSNIDLRFPIDVKTAVKSGLCVGFWGKYPPGAHCRYGEVASLCGINDLDERPIGSLSGGQLQRVLLARAIISDPDLLVLDEPLSYVDREFVGRFYEIIGELSKTTTIILVSHEMNVISGMANRHLTVNHTVKETICC